MVVILPAMYILIAQIRNIIILLISSFHCPFPFHHTNPYANGTAHNEGGFVTFGFFDAYAMIGTVLQEAGKAAWAQKWRVQRALRP